MQFIKIIDQTLCPKTDIGQEGMFNKGMPQHKELNNGCVKVTFFSKTLEALPVIKKVGDIIRIHRANIGIYRNQKTFCINLDFGSSWALFKGASENDIDDVTSQRPPSENSNLKIQNFYENKRSEEKKKQYFPTENDSQDEKQKISTIWPFLTSK